VAQTELLESIEYKVVEDGWDIDRLKHIKKQDWQDYGFGIGTLNGLKMRFLYLKDCGHIVAVAAIK
jgi:hypothetical protein